MGQSSILIRFFLILEGALFSCDIRVVFTFQKFIWDIPMFLFMLVKSNIMPKRDIISFIVMPQIVNKESRRSFNEMTELQLI